MNHKKETAGQRDLGRIAGGGSKLKPQYTRKSKNVQCSRRLMLWPDCIVKPIIKACIVDLAIAGLLSCREATEIIMGGYALD